MIDDYKLDDEDNDDCDNDDNDDDHGKYDDENDDNHLIHTTSSKGCVSKDEHILHWNLFIIIIIIFWSSRIFSF